MNKVILYSVVIILSIGTIQYSSATQCVATRIGQCINQLGYGSIKMKLNECQKIGGHPSGIPSSLEWNDCYLDWCKVPFGQEVARSTVYTICKPDEQTLVTLFSAPIEIFRPYGIIRMKAGDCRSMNGFMNGRPSFHQWTDCHLKFCPFSGNNSGGIKGVVVSQVNECGSFTIGYGIIVMKYRDCANMGGTVPHGHVTGNPWINCQLDFCEKL